MNARIVGRRTRRPAAALVEAAFVITLFLMFVFGIFEYARYLMFLHVSTNAIRDAARYASVNVDKPSDFPTNNFTSGSVTAISHQTLDHNRTRGQSRESEFSANEAKGKAICARGENR